MNPKDLAARLASALRRKDQDPNIELAIELANGREETCVEELFRLLDTGPKKQRHDALKVLYEVAQREPDLVLPFLERLLDGLASRDNRILWGTLYALSALVELAPEPLMEHLPRILDASARSTVIAKDKTMLILVGLAADERFHQAVLPELLAHVEAAATNQFPTYAERAAEVLLPPELPRLIALIEAHEGLDAHPAKRRRMDTLLRRIQRQRTMPT